MTSRIKTGFHRIGIVLAVPLLIAAAVPLIMELYEPTGPFAPDLKSAPEQAVVAWGEPIKSAGSVDPRGSWSQFIPADESRIIRAEVPDNRVLVIDTKDTKLAGEAINAMHDEERRRGRLFTPSEMPLLIGKVSIYYDSESKMPSYGAAHLRRGFDPFAFTLSAVFLGVGLLAYGAARAIAWILDGFIGSKRSTV
jgi:hypothetical protein